MGLIEFGFVFILISQFSVKAHMRVKGQCAFLIVGEINIALPILLVNRKTDIFISIPIFIYLFML